MSNKVLGTIHVWALGVGIVIVGEFMGWNFAVAKGGTLGSILACWIIGFLFISLILINTEMISTIPDSHGGQYAMAKYCLGPLGAFNIGLMLVFEYVMLEAADALVIGEILKSVNPDIQPLPYILLCLLVLTYLNYRGVYITLSVNFVITATALITIFILFFATKFYSPSESLIRIKELSNGLPYGWLGILGALQFAIWFFLGIEGTVLAADECRSKSRSIPVGTILGLITLLIGATITWFVCSGLINPIDLGKSEYPLYEAAKATGSSFVIVALFVGTILACLASANGCITDSARAWSAMSKDTLIPGVFAAVHPKHKTPYRAIVFLLPISIAFGYTGLLDQVITFSILSALLIYILCGIMMIKFRKMYPLDTINREFIAPFHPFPALTLIFLAILTLIGMYFGYFINIISGFTFYFVASVWFKLRREKHVDYDKYLSR